MKLGVLVVAACIVVSSPLRAQALREGRITVVRATSGSNVDAVFSTQPFWGSIIATDGPCTLRGPAVKRTLSAGTIAITGTVEPITLEDQAEKYSPAKRVPNPAFIDGATINVDASGTADVPAFSASVNAPTTPADYAPPSSLSRAGYTATWMPVPGAHMMIMIGAFDPRSKDGVMVMCRFDDTGRFTIPASTFNLIPKHFDHAIAFFARTAETVQTVGDFSVSVEVASAVMSGPFALAASTPVAVTSPRSFMSVSVGLGGMSRVDDDRPTDTTGVRLQSAMRVAHGFYFLSEVSFLHRDNISPSLPITEDDTYAGIGLRWTPFKPHPIRWGNGSIDTLGFYATATLGFDIRQRVTQITPNASSGDSDYSPATSLSIGWFGLQGRDWSFGPELREQLTDYNGHAQWGWQTLLAIHLNL